MGRIPRPNLPGHPFHLTTRLQDRAHRFTAPVRDHVLRLLERQVLRSDISLLAFVIMTNHLHLVLIQGAAPLSHFMQPFLRSVALLVQSAYGIEGHVFERRYRDTVCWDADHVRNAIAYTHANPLRAGLCERLQDYRWSSHRLYAGRGGLGRAPLALDLTRGLRTFAPEGAASWDEVRSAYAGFMARALDDLMADDSASAASDGATAQLQAHGARRASGTPPAERPTIESIAYRVLRSHKWTLADLQSRWGPRDRLEGRAAVARACAIAGFTGCEIATLLRVSEAAVSRLLARTLPDGVSGASRSA